MTGYERIKQIAKDDACKVGDLIVLAPQNDPFYAGSPATLTAARWFAELWKRFGYSEGVHLRRAHYQIVSQADIPKPDGELYQNTEGDWGVLCNAAKYARYLGLVSPDAFVDRRNPAPHIFTDGDDGSDDGDEPDLEIDDPFWSLPSIRTEMGWSGQMRLPTPRVSGYEYSHSAQPYHVELWAEKSTMDDILLPLGRELGANVVTSLGFQSITSVIALLRRVADLDKPARIFYISDFDPAGDGMPVAVARQIEFWLQDYAPDADIALTPLVLTREQVTKHKLPRIPVKDTDRRKANFEERYGEGAVELDALEALHPGELERLVRDAIAPYRDDALCDALESAEADAQRHAETKWSLATANYATELAEIDVQARHIAKGYEERLEQLSAKLDAELAPLQERLDSLRQAIIETRDGFEVELPSRPDPNVDPGDEDDWLFCSEREYTEQLAVYKARKQPFNKRKNGHPNSNRAEGAAARAIQSLGVGAKDPHCAQEDMPVKVTLVDGVIFTA